MKATEPEHDKEAYDAWQRQAEKREASAAANKRRLAIEKGDPESEKVKLALEQGWTSGR